MNTPQPRLLPPKPSTPQRQPVQAQRITPQNPVGLGGAGADAFVPIAGLLGIGLGVGGGFVGYKYGGAKHRVAGTILGIIGGLIAANIATAVVVAVVQPSK